jgi:hypothetical protein
MNNNIFLIGLIILLALSSPVMALNETPIIEQVSMYIHGNANYANGLPLPMGTEIIAKDQFGSGIGSYIIHENGKIGKDYGGTSDNFAINVWRNQSDKANRTLPIFISFSIDNISTKNSLTFIQNENLQFDIITSSLPPTPLITTIKTTIVTVPTTISNTTLTTNTVVPITVTHQPLLPDLSTNDYIYYGIIATLIIVIAMIIITIGYSYMYDKISRDDVIGPEDKYPKSK